MQFGLNEPSECGHCGCPRFEIERQYKIRGFIVAIWKCTHCHARNQSRTPNGFLAEQKEEEAANGHRGSRRSGKKKRHWWGDD